MICKTILFDYITDLDSMSFIIALTFIKYYIGMIYTNKIFKYYSDLDCIIFISEFFSHTNNK